jgi:hypothetical protein
LAGKELSASRPPRLLLQLHALTNNPMSLTITEDITVSAKLEASVPTTETRLLSTMDVNTTVTITVPAGVKVLKVAGDVYHENDGEVELKVYSVTGQRTWLYMWDYEGVSNAWYVGVTPNKSYTLKLGTSSSTGTESGSVVISYSQSINNQTPKVTDY